MHNVLPNSRAFVRHLERAARRTGVVIVTRARAKALITDGGRMTAVDCEMPHGRRMFAARGGVVLAADDFTNDPDLKAKYMGGQEAKASGVNPTATGDGQKLGVALGARILNGDLALGPELRFVPPQRQNFLLKLPSWSWLASFMARSLDHMRQAVLRPFIMSFVTTALARSPGPFEAGARPVNGQGARFCEEREASAPHVPDQPDSNAFIILDARMAGSFTRWPHFVSTAPGVAYAYLADFKRNRRDIYHEAPTLNALNGRLDMPRGALARTVEAYNKHAGKRRHFGKSPSVALGPARAVFVHNEGGLAVDQQRCMLRDDNAPIPGLYAAGSTGQGGLLLNGQGHHLAWTFVSGRGAGRNAAFATVTSAT